MPPFKDEQIIIIAPGSQTTLAQLGLPESLTPARLRVRSRMFQAEKDGEWEPYKVRRKDGGKPEEQDEIRDMQKTLGEADDEVIYEEDHISDEGAVWPMEEGRIVNWPCFFALMTHVYNTLNPPFHTPILLIGQPAWTPKEKERLTQFFFEKFKMPAFTIMDSATAIAYAYGASSATVVDVGFQKSDVTAISDFIMHETGRAIAIPECGGDAMTRRLLELLKPRGLNWEMCEQLKKNPICEILPPNTPLPGSGENSGDGVTNPAAAASTGATGSGPDAAAAIGNAPRGPGLDTEVGDEGKEDEESEGVLDVASIVTSGKMNELLAKKEKEKQEKAAAKKKGADTAKEAANKPMRLPNAKREKATFMYEDHALLNALKDTTSGQKLAEAAAALDEGPQRKGADGDSGQNDPMTGVEINGALASLSGSRGPIRREIEVGVERFQAASGGVLERLADAIYRTVASVEEVNKRSELWDSLIIVGNGAKIRGFKEALVAILQTKYLISPSSATIFTSELPSNLSTPTATGANTPQHPGLQPSSSGVNPLLYAATTAQNPQMMHASQGSTPGPMSGMHSHNTHSSHGQSPTSIKLVKAPEYFPEWKEVGMDEAMFLGAQVAAKVLFIVDQGLGQGYMTRTDYNDQGPSGIRDVCM
ncbi:putative chromatin remodeling complex subunit protein [Neofusicoccum parvum]|uniref:Putative chromatin remodeling complex subunit protein n=1 Tax=Botryosphaeria parva (strain UCR-NP2) TaxID=1287680 RepID=R1ELG9_BOTPV|nr:putative chromatin remodeling complex subunit protein [Neofusicoccum parvum UCRNP2]GME63962.1 putative chromatin remodeling complex subunit protein [Neofusicoccum parvum]